MRAFTAAMLLFGFASTVGAQDAEPAVPEESSPEASREPGPTEEPTPPSGAGSGDAADPGPPEGDAVDTGTPFLDPPDTLDPFGGFDEDSSDPRWVRINVFGSVDLQLWDSEDDQIVALGLATLDLLFASRAWDVVFAMVDVLAEEDNNEFRFVIDRYMIRFDIRQYFQIALGQIHSPLIQWNRRVAHGFYLQTPISRPKFLDREIDQGVFSTHLLALSINGELGSSGVGYFVAVANGRGPTLDQLAIREDPNRHKALVANVSYQPFADGRLRLDATFVNDRITTDPEDLDERDVSLSFQWDGPHLELRAEAAAMILTGRATDLRSTVWGGYALVGVKIDTSIGELRPYVMTSQLFVDDVFPTLEYFLPSELTEYESSYHLGLRWEYFSGVAVKLEYILTAPDEHAAGLQVAFGY